MAGRRDRQLRLRRPPLAGTVGRAIGLAALILAVPPALDGESVGGNNTAIAVISVVSIVSGYLLLAALWYFVFRDKSRSRRKKQSPD